MSSPIRPEASISPFDTRIDGFWRGRFALVQPVGQGYRSGLDALLLASTLAPDAKGRLADLGAGAGAVGFACAARAPRLDVVCVEKMPEMVGLLAQGLALTENESFADRVSSIEVDLLAPRRDLDEAGLRVGDFDHVVTNPPFYPAGHRISPDPLRAASLNAPEADFLAHWMRSSLALLKDGGRFSAILPPEALGECLPVYETRLGAIAITPIHAREGEAAIRILITGRKGSRAPLAILPGCFLHKTDGTPSEFSRNVSEGEALFGWR
ncbi:MAG: methyltransferase [Fulvimarina manganoxydans]|uniref:tRNA1(Val) (adenine(37)-N6)-methyltransferase n=1 Tax=Fulvimarina manganoxydans TaxID=937218 RepID=UPI002353867F|nr:methyltransferase [Fulvimarina manganoxydans]MCK5931628.1 methyltransferase [Fulvimarina manganoxydans]